MNLRDSPRRRREHPDMEITPLIDVVFLLLIFFLITTSFSEASQEIAREEIPLNLPKTTTGEPAQQPSEPVTLRVRADGTIEFAGEATLEGDTLRRKLENLYARRPEARIRLQGDSEVSHGRIVELFDQIRQVGFSGVNLVTQRDEGAGAGADE
jgi:biopolymer transport protein ExbD